MAGRPRLVALCRATDRSSPSARWCFAAVPQVIWRFDIFAALFTALALVAVASRKPGLGWLRAGTGGSDQAVPGIPGARAVRVLPVRPALARSAMVVFGFAALMVALGALLIFVAGRDALHVPDLPGGSWLRDRECRRRTGDAFGTTCSAYASARDFGFGVVRGRVAGHSHVDPDRMRC